MKLLKSRIYIAISLLVFSLSAQGQLKVNIKNGNTEVCVGDTLVLESEVLSGGPTTYTWSGSSASFLTPSSTSCGIILSNSTYIYLTTYDGSSQYVDSVFVKLNLLPAVKLQDGNYCQTIDSINLKGDKVILLPGNTNLGTQFWNCLNCSDSAWSKILNNNYPDTSGYPQDYYLNLRDSALDLANLNSKTLQLELAFRNAYGCYNYDTTEISVYRKQNAEIIDWALQVVTNNPPYLFCQTNPNITLVTKNDLKGSWSSPFWGSVYGDIFYPKLSPYKRFFIRFDYDPAQGCESSDSVEVEIEQLPFVQITTNDTTICEDGELTIEVSAEYERTSGINWIPFRGATIDNTNSKNVNFTTTLTLDTLEQFNLYVRTDPGNACPFVDDLFTLWRCPKDFLGIGGLIPETLSIYPNPSQGSFVFETFEPFDLELYNSIGKRVEDWDYTPHGIVVYQPGIYVARITLKDQKRVIIKRLIVH